MVETPQSLGFVLAKGGDGWRDSLRYLSRELAVRLRRVAERENATRAESDTLAIGQSVSGGVRESVAKSHRCGTTVRQVTTMTMVTLAGRTAGAELCGLCRS
jgi:hypothetical protein